MHWCGIAQSNCVMQAASVQQTSCCSGAAVTMPQYRMVQSSSVQIYCTLVKKKCRCMTCRFVIHLRLPGRSMPCLSEQTQLTKCSPTLTGKFPMGTATNSSPHSAVSDWSVLHFTLFNFARYTSLGLRRTWQKPRAPMHSKVEMAQLAMWSDSQQ